MDHLVVIMELGHLVTRYVLTHSEVSTVFPGFFCLLVCVSNNVKCLGPVRGLTIAVVQTYKVSVCCYTVPGSWCEGNLLSLLQPRRRDIYEFSRRESEENVFRKIEHAERPLR